MQYLIVRSLYSPLICNSFIKLSLTLAFLKSTCQVFYRMSFNYETNMFLTRGIWEMEKEVAMSRGSTNSFDSQLINFEVVFILPSIIPRSRETKTRERMFIDLSYIAQYYWNM